MMAIGEVRPGSRLHYLPVVASILCWWSIPGALSEEFPEFLEQPQSQIISYSDPVTLKCSATPSEAQIRWLFEGQPLDERRHRNLEIIGSNLHFPHHQPREDHSNNGEYRCTATTTMGTVISQPAVLSKPDLSRFPPASDITVTVPEGGFVTLTCEPPRSRPPATVAFQTDDGEVVDTSQATVTQLPSGNVVLSNITSASAGDFRCVATNAVSRQNRTSSWTISVVVDPTLAGMAPVAHIMTGMRRKVQVEIGSDITLECPTYGHQGANFTWRKYGGSLPVGRFALSDFGNLKISSTQYEDSGTFRCMTDAEMREEGQVFLEILTPPVIQVVKEQEAAVEVGSRVEMACTVVGFPKPYLKWFHNGRELNNKDEGPLILAMVSAADTGIYQCMATNMLGTAYGVLRLKVGGQQKGPITHPEKLPVLSSDDEDEGASSGDGVSVNERRKLGRRDRIKNGRQKTVKMRDRRKKKKNGLSGHGDNEKPKYAPSVPTVTQLSDRSVMLNWSVPDKGNGQTIKFFKVQFKEISPEKGPWRTSDAHLAYNIRRFEVSDLKSVGSYKFRILAVYEDDDNKNSRNSPILKLSVQPHAQARVPDTAPTIVEAKPIVYQQNFGIGVKWQYKAESASPIEGFIIFYKPFGASEDKEKEILGAGIRNDVIRDLLPNTPYNIRMQSFTSAGRSQFSNQVVKTTKARADSPVKEDYPDPEIPIKEPDESTEAPVSERPNSDSLDYHVVLGVVLGALILALIILVTMCWWKQRQQKRRSLGSSPQQKFQDQSQCIFTDGSHTKPNGGLYMVNGTAPIANGHGPHSGDHSRMNIDVNPLAEYDMQTTVPGGGRPKQFYGNGVNGSVPRFTPESSCHENKFQHSGSTHHGCNGGDGSCLESQKSLYCLQHRTLPLAPSQQTHSFYSEAGSLGRPANHEYSEVAERELHSPGLPHSMCKQNIGHHGNNTGHMRSFDYNWSGTYDQPRLDKTHFSSGERLSPMYSPTSIDYAGVPPVLYQQQSSKRHISSLPKCSAVQAAAAANFGPVPELASPSNQDSRGGGKHKRRKKRPHPRDHVGREHAVRDQATNTDLSSNEGTFDFATFCKSGSSSNSGSEVGGQNCDSSFANNGSLESMNEDCHSTTSTGSHSHHPDFHFSTDLSVKPL